MTRAFILGDSHVGALGPMLLEAGRAIGWEPAGFLSNRGWSTAKYKNESAWREQLSAARPDLVVVVLGTNDAAQGQQVYVQQLRAVAEAVRASGARQIIWVGPPSAKARHIDERADRIAPWQQSFLPQMDVKWIDSRQMTFGGHAPDGIHFTRAGYRAWANALIDDMRGAPGVPVARQQKADAGGIGGMVPWIGLAVLVVFLLKPRKR